MFLIIIYMWLNTCFSDILQCLLLCRFLFFHKRNVHGVSPPNGDHPGQITSSSSFFRGIGPLVDPFRSHASRSLFNGLPWFLLPVGKYCFITLGNLLRGILFTWCIQFLLYSCSLSKTGVIFNSFAICVFVLWSVQVYPAVRLMYFISVAVILVASLALMVQDHVETIIFYSVICWLCLMIVLLNACHNIAVWNFALK